MQEKSVPFFTARCMSYCFYREIFICGDCAVATPFKMPSNRVAGDALRPAQAAFVCMDMPGKEESVDGLVPAGLFREKVSHGTAAFEPVVCKDVKGRL